MDAIRALFPRWDSKSGKVLLGDGRIQWLSCAETPNDDPSESSHELNVSQDSRGNGQALSHTGQTGRMRQIQHAINCQSVKL